MDRDTIEAILDAASCGERWVASVDRTGTTIVVSDCESLAAAAVAAVRLIGLEDRPALVRRMLRGIIEDAVAAAVTGGDTAESPQRFNQSLTFHPLTRGVL